MATLTPTIGAGFGAAGNLPEPIKFSKPFLPTGLFSRQLATSPP
jgi:hypothetical protein